MRIWKYIPAFAIIALSNGAIAQERDQVNARYSWTVRGEYAPFYLAQERGYYDRARLSVQLAPGTSTQTALSTMLQGQDDVVIMPAVFALTAIQKNLPVKIVALYHEVTPMGLISFPDNPIRTPKDLEGKSIATSVGDTAATYLGVLCELNNVDCTKIKKVQVNPQVRYTQFIQKQVDTVSVYYTDALPILEQSQKIEFTLLDLPTYGVKIPGLSFVTSEINLDKKVGLLNRFVMAVDQGIRDSKKDPEAAADAMMKHWENHPDRSIVLAQVRATLAAMTEPIGHPYGWVEERAINAALQIMKAAKEIDNPLPGKSYFSNKLIQ